ncbi:MAG TPA: hypothetical protein VHJ40_05795 [Actinomycetota bacterium]|nr:hypothetical protein [Actinomycetota bacterium]
MPSVDVWIWVLLVGIVISMVMVVGTATYRAASSAGWTPTARKRTVVAVVGTLAVWLAVGTILASAGVFRPNPDFALPAIGPAVAIPIIAGSLLVWRSASLRRLLEAVPQPWLLAAQAPRVLGAIFLVLLAQNKLPAHFAGPAGYGDVFIGLAAPLVAYIYAVKAPGSRGLATAFNVAGLGDLVMVLGTGLLSAPSPFRLFFSNPSIELMTVLPMALIPAFLVPIFVLLHVISLRKLMEERSRTGRVGLPLSPA